MTDIERLHYEYAVLYKMVEELPEKIRKPFLQQLESVKAAHTEYMTVLNSVLQTGLEDLRIEIKAMNFDLVATKRERDQLQQILDDQSELD